MGRGDGGAGRAVIGGRGRRLNPFCGAGRAVMAAGHRGCARAVLRAGPRFGPGRGAGSTGTAPPAGLCFGSLGGSQNGWGGKKP